MRITIEQFFRLRQSNAKLYVITSKTRGQGVQSMVKGQISYTRQKSAG
jgi:hypothetical protein